jgi:Periplasmic protease
VRLALVVLLLPALAAIASADEAAHIEVEHVYEKPGDTAQSFEDSRVVIGTSFHGSFGVVHIRNRTRTPLTIQWSEAAIIDPAGKSRRIFMRDLPFEQRASFIEPSVVAPGDEIEREIAPLDYAHSATYIQPLIKWPSTAGDIPGSDLRSPAYRRFMSEYKGKTFAFVLPLTFVDGTRIYIVRYRFDFTDNFAYLERVDNEALPATSGITAFLDGNRIEAVEPGSVAKMAGLLPGDRIIEVNGKSTVAIAEDLLEIIDRNLSQNRNLVLLYERDGVEKMIVLRP